MNEKAKVDKPVKPRVNRYGFLGLWVGGQVIGWLLFILVLEAGFAYLFNQVTIDGDWIFALFMAIFVGIPTILAQKLALYLGFGRWFRGWTRANLIGWFLGSFIFAVLLQGGRTGNVQFDLTIQILVMMLFPAIAQAWIFSRYVQRIWLWLVSTVVASMVSAAMALPFNDGSYKGIFVAFGSYAVVTGLTLLWLFGMQASENQSKNIVDTSRLEDRSDEISEPEIINESSTANERESESR